MRHILPVCFVMFQVSTGHPLLDAALNNGGLAVLGVVLWLLLTKSEKRNVEMAEGYRNDFRESITVRTAVLSELSAVREELREARKDREAIDDELLRRIAEMVRR